MLDHHRDHPPACSEVQCSAVQGNRAACGQILGQKNSPPLAESTTSSTVAGPALAAPAAGPALREANCSAAFWAAIPLASSGFASPKITYVSLTGDL